ncbi:hypothetical protein CORC01_13212 [Colletotrichum orchidophilum]|uniref:Uncharacterized protein n=1 Tax=Colletotrichum orchidophilum TaxID=1209926 RepID=A0A1G4AQP7_9PEZI|nr:uncharacterized protein CORC01_13212 [Colletotrichum orchidophilum]OHE91479.1 hypothetical protein CORC01_13212 [Colletotrichum orchidophilum]
MFAALSCSSKQWTRLCESKGALVDASTGCRVAVARLPTGRLMKIHSFPGRWQRLPGAKVPPSDL